MDGEAASISVLVECPRKQHGCILHRKNMFVSDTHAPCKYCFQGHLMNTLLCHYDISLFAVIYLSLTTSVCVANAF